MEKKKDFYHTENRSVSPVSYHYTYTFLFSDIFMEVYGKHYSIQLLCNAWNWGKLNFTGFLMLLSYTSSFFIINSDLPVSTLLFCLSRGFCNEKKNNGKFLKVSICSSEESYIGKLALYGVLF